MKCSEIIKILETLSPRSMACDWDNPGLLAGRSGKEVKTIFLAVDATDSVIEQAEQAGADMDFDAPSAYFQRNQAGVRSEFHRQKSPADDSG